MQYMQYFNYFHFIANIAHNNYLFYFSLIFKLIHLTSAILVFGYSPIQLITLFYLISSIISLLSHLLYFIIDIFLHHILLRGSSL
jgi:hypothetical protein